ncbi:hypothetical protein L1887_05859 [Cichorium endivia]|nr:hypothetical protein L1887_05859 [Cichorium endivia]
MPATFIFFTSDFTIFDAKGKSGLDPFYASRLQPSSFVTSNCTIFDGKGKIGLKKRQRLDDECFEIVSDEDNTKQDGTLNSFVKKQTTMNQATKNRESVDRALCRLLYGEALSFNLANYEVKLRLYSVIEKRYDRPTCIEIHEQLDKFNESIGMFGLSATKTLSKKMQPTSGG